MLVVVMRMGAQPGHGALVDGGLATLRILAHALHHRHGPVAGGPLDGEVGGSQAFLHAAAAVGVPQIVVHRVHRRRRTHRVERGRADAEADGPVAVPVQVALFDADVVDQPVAAQQHAGGGGVGGLGQGQRHVVREVGHQRVEVQQRAPEARQREVALGHFRKQHMVCDAVLERHQPVPELLGPERVWRQLDMAVAIFLPACLLPAFVLGGVHRAFSDGLGGEGRQAASPGRTYVLVWTLDHRVGAGKAMSSACGQDHRRGQPMV